MLQSLLFFVAFEGFAGAAGLFLYGAAINMDYMQPDSCGCFNLINSVI